MEKIYHTQVLRRALGSRVSARALAAITAANLNQDAWRNLLRPHYHFDNSLFATGLAYIEASREQAARAAQPAEAWAAFGRLSHAAQDFYSHSNYIALWLRGFPEGQPPPVDAVEPLDTSVLRHPELTSGRIYALEVLYFVPGLRGLALRLLPRDSHAWMNLDSPAAGPLFPYSIEAAVKRTAVEFERTLAAIGETQGEDALRAFLDV